MKLERSRELFDRASKLIPWGTQTNAKRWREPEYAPAFIESGKGCRIRDVDGNEYIDFKCALGPVILGHADMDVNAAVREQVDRGTMFNMSHPLEVALAERLARIVPCAERVRFLKTGSDANCAAVRIARAATGRDGVITFGYHGWNDMTNAGRPELGGVPAASRELVLALPPHDLDGFREALRARGRETAIVIIDAANHGEVAPGYLETVRDLCRENGIVLAFDEIITGFRYALGGAQEYFGVTPDLACFAKGMANGYSIAALCGRAAVMDPGFEKTVITGTYYGATTDLAAAVATIDKLEREKVPALLWQRGRRLVDLVNGSASRHGLGLRAVGPECIFRITVDNPGHHALFRRMLHEYGIFPGSSYWFMQYAHTDEVLAEAGEIIETVCRKVKNAA